MSALVVAFLTLIAVASGDSDLVRNLVTVVYGIVPPLVLLAIGTFLWKKADAIALHIYPHNDDPATCDINAAATTDLLAVAFASIGMYILVSAIPELVNQIARPMAMGVSMQQAWENAGWQVEFWTSLLQVGLGLWLMLGMRGIARIVKRFQRDDPPDESAGGL